MSILIGGGVVAAWIVCGGIGYFLAKAEAGTDWTKGDRNMSLVCAVLIGAPFLLAQLCLLLARWSDDDTPANW